MPIGQPRRPGRGPGAPKRARAFGERLASPTNVKRLADDLYLLDGFPPHAINVYLIGDVLVDAGSRFAARRTLRVTDKLPDS